MQRLVPFLFVLCAWSPILALPAHAVVAAELEDLIAALTDHRRPVHEPAMDALIGLGPDVLPDLAILASDPNAQVRARVAMTAAGIGGRESFPLLRRLGQDRSAYVREVAVLGLGRTAHPEALPLLIDLLRDPLPQVRESAALALGTLGDQQAIPALAWWPQAGGARGNLRLAGPPEGEAQLRRIQRAMQASLRALVLQPEAIPLLPTFFAQLEAPQLVALLETTWEIGDTRLAPSLARLLGHEDDEVRRAAAVSLAANGDGRALEALCAIASGDPAVAIRDAAARSLRRLTGHQAAAGPAWALWWRDHREAVRAGFERDAYIAELHDPARTTAPAELARFTPAELMPLVDGALGSGAPWWPRRAWLALGLDERERWTDPLLERYFASGEERERVGLVVVLDALGDPIAHAELERLYRAMHQQRQSEPGPHRQGSLYLALMLAAVGHDPRSLASARR